MHRLLALCVILLGCDGPGTGPVRPDAGERPDAGRRSVDAGNALETDGGVLDDDLCGAVALDESLVVPEGEVVRVCAGSTISAGAGVEFTVRGTLLLEGTAAARIQLQGDPRWGGLLVEGTLGADFTDILDAELAIRGGASSNVRFDDGGIFAEAGRNLDLANGGTFDRTRIVGGGSVTSSGGVLSMTDSVVDLMNPRASPDCTHIGGGGLQLDHVQVTNCHCPLHISRTTAPIAVTNSILDGAVYPVMIAESTGTFRGNALSGTSAHFLDIGGGIDVDIAGNYYEGEVPVTSGGDPSQFRGADDRLMERPADVGPR